MEMALPPTRDTDRAAQPGENGDPALAALADDFWEAFLEINPRFATSVGDRRYDDRLEDHSPAGIAASRARYAALTSAVEGLDESALGPEDRVTHSALVESLRSELAALDTGLESWSVDPLEGVPVGLLQIADYQRLDGPPDGHLMTARWRAMAAFTDTHAGNLRRSLADGLVAPRAPVERVIDVLGRLLGQPDAEWPLLAPLATVDGLVWSETERSRLASELSDIVARSVRPAFVRLHTTLTDEILPAARGDDRPGVGVLPGGADAYRALIRYHTSLDRSPHDIHATGLAEVERIDAELASLTGSALGVRDLPAALARLRGDASLHFATRDEVRQTAEGCLARAVEAVPAWFGRLPQAPCEVVVMGEHEEEHSTIAYYRQPAADRSRPGRYYINTSHPETRPRYEAEALAYHEAVPGHHLQIAIGQELGSLPAFRRHLGPTAFFEGWGLYTERLADEMGLYSGPLDRIGVASYDAWRACRLVVDTGIHALGWSRDRAISFMTEHTALGTNNIANEVDRYIVWPGQALAYKTGQLELLRLRRAAEERLGTEFEIRQFHDVVLGSGALPLGTLAAVVGAESAAPV